MSSLTAKRSWSCQLPRYISGKCCTDRDHITNWGKGSLLADPNRACEMAELAITAIERSTNVNILEVFGSTDPNLSEVKTGSGHSIWLDSDPVHLSHHAYVELAAMVQNMLQQEDTDLCPHKRARLESVVPALPGGRRGHQGSILPPLWVSRMATRGESRGRGGERGGYRGQATPSSWRPRPLGIRALPERPRL